MPLCLSWTSPPFFAVNDDPGNNGQAEKMALQVNPLILENEDVVISYQKACIISIFKCIVISRVQPSSSAHKLGARRMFPKSNLTQVTKIYISYADEDIHFLEGLKGQLRSLELEGLVHCYTRYESSPGSEWRKEAQRNLYTADIILLLVSPSFSDSEPWEEATAAMALHNSAKAHVIPIIVRPVLWENSIFGKLASLPRGEPVSMWKNQENAFFDVVKEIKETVVHKLRSTQQVSSTDKPLPIGNVPYWRNPFFTDREEILATLHSTFTSPSPLKIQALSGLAGVGKTQIAVEYAYRYMNNYQAVLWARADSPEILQSSFVELSEVLDLPEKNNDGQLSIIKAVKRWLQQNTQWLLVVDNLEDIDLLRNMIPSPHTGHILATTHSSRTGHIAHRIDVEPLQTDDGALLLLRRAKLLAPDAVPNTTPTADIAEAKKIAQTLQGLPLALDQAGAYIEETRRGLADYEKLYQQYSSALLGRRGASSQDHPDSVTATFSLSFEKLKTLNPIGVELLEFCAFLHPDAIPEEMIIAGASALPLSLRAATADPIVFDQAIEDLLKFSFVRRKSDQNILIVHRLVQAVIKEEMSDDKRHDYSKLVVHAINAAFPTPKLSNWAQCQKYLSQAQACAKLIQQENILLPEAAQLFYRMGRYLYQRGVYHEAEALLLHTLTMEEALFGTDHPDLIPTLNMLARIQYEQGKYSQIELLLQRTLALGEKHLGTEHPEIGESLYRLGRTYHQLGRYSEAEPLLQRALALRQKSLGQEHPDVARSLDSLAILYNRQGKYEQAEALYTQALIIRQATLDPHDLDIAANFNNLALFYGRQGKYTQAEPLAEQAVKIYAQAFGQEHPRFVNVLDTLAEIYQEQRKYTQAESLYQQIFTVAHKTLGGEHPKLVAYGNHLARLYLLEGKYAEAEDTARNAFKLGEKVLGPNHRRVATALHIAADACKAQKKYVEAEEFYSRALKIREQVLAPNDINIAITLESYADLLQTMERQTESEAQRKRAASIRREQSPN
jgi:tetratricopeptide (TPR) repeat protein